MTNPTTNQLLKSQELVSSSPTSWRERWHIVIDHLFKTVDMEMYLRFGGTSHSNPLISKTKPVFKKMADMCEKFTSKELELLLTEVMDEVEAMDGIRRGKWLIHPDYISRQSVLVILALLKQKQEEI